MFVVTAHTPAYAEYAADLAASVTRHGSHLISLPLDETGSWRRNCAQKARVCHHAFKMLREPFLWLDADAEVRRPLDPIWQACVGADIGFHLRGGTELLSGTLYFGAGFWSGMILRLWEDRCAKDPDTWDQKTLAAVLEEFDPERIEVAPLPPAACFIGHSMSKQHPEADPIVWHRQASRVMKKHVGP